VIKMKGKLKWKNKVIDGKRWSYSQGFMTKKEALEHAERKREYYGLKARELKGKTIYGIGADGQRLVCYRVYTRKG